MLCIPELLIVKISERSADVNFVPLLPGIQDKGGSVGRIRQLDGQNIAGIVCAQSILRVGTDRVRLADKRTVNVQLNRDILAGTELRELLRPLFSIRYKGKAFGISMVNDFGDDTVLNGRMQPG